MRHLLDPETAACVLAVVLGLVAFAIMALALTLTSPPPETGATAARSVVATATPGRSAR